MKDTQTQTLGVWGKGAVSLDLKTGMKRVLGFDSPGHPLSAEWIKLFVLTLLISCETDPDAAHSAERSLSHDSLLK